MTVLNRIQSPPAVDDSPTSRADKDRKLGMCFIVHKYCRVHEKRTEAKARRFRSSPLFAKLLCQNDCAQGETGYGCNLLHQTCALSVDPTVGITPHWLVHLRLDPDNPYVCDNACTVTANALVPRISCSTLLSSGTPDSRQRSSRMRGNWIPLYAGAERNKTASERAAATSRARRATMKKNRPTEQPSQHNKCCPGAGTAVPTQSVCPDRLSRTRPTGPEPRY